MILFFVCFRVILIVIIWVFIIIIMLRVVNIFKLLQLKLYITMSQKCFGKIDIFVFLIF